MGERLITEWVSLTDDETRASIVNYLILSGWSARFVHEMFLSGFLLIPFERLKDFYKHNCF